ncbi:MAG: hypothetical protein QG596_1694 [Actinomycetota bacterium]|jgi:hypothetical protein|nr:hypothetical protein [Actinomycetota bacterium]
MKRLAAIVATAVGVLPFSASASGADEPVYWKHFGDTTLPGAGKSVQEPEQMIVYKPNSGGQVCSGCGWRLVCQGRSGGTKGPCNVVGDW